jgi:hypothetical protein
MSVFYRDACPGISLHSSGADKHYPFALSDRFGYVSNTIGTKLCKAGSEYRRMFSRPGELEYLFFRIFHFTFFFMLI